MPNEYDLGDTIAGNSIKFEAIGDRVRGTILDVDRRQDTDFTTREPSYWPDGREKMVTVVALEVDGERRTLYARGGNYNVGEGSGVALERAIVDAVVKATGGTRIAAGGELVIERTGTAEPTQRGYRPAALYTAAYAAPVKSADLGDLLSDRS